MTAQMNDQFLYEGELLSIVGISEGKLFDPVILELKPTMLHTACWRGYQAVYAISDNQVVLADLHIHLIQDLESKPRTDQSGPLINGVKPVGRRKGHSVDFNNNYHDLSLPLEYSGGILLAKDFISELYVHMGFHPAWKYERVVELVFENGLLKASFDRSEQMAEMRKHFTDNITSKNGEAPRQPTSREISDFVDRAFDQCYSRDML